MKKLNLIPMSKFFLLIAVIVALVILFIIVNPYSLLSLGITKINIELDEKGQSQYVIVEISDSEENREIQGSVTSNGITAVSVRSMQDDTLIYKQFVANGKRQKISIDFSDYPAGTYQFIFQSEEASEAYLQIYFDNQLLANKRAILYETSKE